MRIDIKTNRFYAFLLITVIYVLAVAVGILTFNLLKFDIWLNLLIADVVSTVFVFLFSIILKNASVYDPYWSVQPLVILLAFACNFGIDFPSFLLLFAVFVWGIRLTANWAYTFHAFSYEDWRYIRLREISKKFYPLVNFFGIHLFPTLVVYLCTLPAVYFIILKPSISPVFIMSILICLSATLLQGVSDYQMHKYRLKKETPFIRTGLWKYSRHPNYLGEILMWWGVAIAVLSSFQTLNYLIVGAIINTLMFIFISVPLADNRQSSKTGFNEYKKETRMLLPIYKK